MVKLASYPVRNNVNFSRYILFAMDDSSYRLNFDLGKNEIHHYSYEEQLKISKIAKFGREML